MREGVPGKSTARRFTLSRTSGVAYIVKSARFLYFVSSSSIVFTGMVEEIGQVESTESRQDNVRLAIRAAIIHTDASIGDSISINGCCLTIVGIDGDLLQFDAVPETLQRTNLGQLEPGSGVNLERALRPDSRLGGHYVTGHVDGLGTIRSLDDNEEWRKIFVEVDPQLTRQMSGKGSVAIDGISLTLVDVDDNSFSVVLIPHTREVTTIGRRKPGDRVNIETDLLAKYVERQLQYLQSDVS
ncbi:MAG: riboflavin synthase [Pirellulaceae bacterium]